jgi:regulator of sirC expression with transglutaminase-like and TPR domain
MLLGNANDRELTEVLATTLSSLFFDKPPFADAANQIRSSLDQIAETVRSRFIYPNPTVEHKMDALQRVFYEEMHFCGNTDDYYNIGNSLLHSTLERKTAIPLTLAILYQCIGRRIGVDVDIIGLPGHIVVGLPEMELYVDVFREGKLLTRDDCGTIVNGYGIDMNEEFLQPINATDVFLRNCNNLSNCLRRVTQYDTRVVAVQILRLAGGIPFEDTRACRESLPLMWARAHVQYGDRLPVW